MEYPCPYCNKPFDTRSGKNKHIQAKHRNSYFACKLCDGKKFANRDNVQKHVKTYHAMHMETTNSTPADLLRIVESTTQPTTSTETTSSEPMPKRQRTTCTETQPRRTSPRTTTASTSPEKDVFTAQPEMLRELGLPAHTSSPLSDIRSIDSENMNTSFTRNHINIDSAMQHLQTASTLVDQLSDVEHQSPDSQATLEYQKSLDSDTNAATPTQQSQPTSGSRDRAEPLTPSSPVRSPYVQPFEPLNQQPKSPATPDDGNGPNQSGSASDSDTPDDSQQDTITFSDARYLYNTPLPRDYQPIIDEQLASTTEFNNDSTSHRRHREIIHQLDRIERTQILQARQQSFTDIRHYSLYSTQTEKLEKTTTDLQEEINKLKATNAELQLQVTKLQAELQQQKDTNRNEQIAFKSREDTLLKITEDVTERVKRYQE